MPDCWVDRGGELYAFKHALTRDVAYASLLRSRRQICHQRIATALEDFDDGFVRAAEPELLAIIIRKPGILVRRSPIGLQPAMLRSSAAPMRKPSLIIDRPGPPKSS